MMLKIISWHNLDWDENVKTVFMKKSTLMTSGMDLEEELLQMETILLGNWKKEWGMDGEDMFKIQKQISLRSLI